MCSSGPAVDATATHLSDIVGRVIIDDRYHPAYAGADAHSEMQAHLVGVVAGLEALAARGDTEPLLLRLSDPAAAECVAGVWEPATASRLRSQLLSLINAARAHRGHVWVAGFDEHRLNAFGERATALAAVLARCPALGASPWGGCLQLHPIRCGRARTAVCAWRRSARRGPRRMRTRVHRRAAGTAHTSLSRLRC